MPLTAAEKQRRYRLKRDEDQTRREEYLRKGRERWKQYREDGTIKYASQMTEREQRQNRNSWRKQKRTYRETPEKSDECMTPPALSWKSNARITGHARPKKNQERPFKML